MCFNQIVIHFAAPTICGIKPANLFSVKKEDFSIAELRKWKKMLAEHGITIEAVLSDRSSFQIFVYNLRWLKKILSDSLVCKYLKDKGYSSCLNASKAVSLILQRMKNINEFPHEIGIVLGYPVKDVIEFERHEGRNCKYCGYWKSYSDVENAKACQCRFRTCSCMCRKWFDEGYSLSQIVEEYKKAVNIA